MFVYGTLLGISLGLCTGRIVGYNAGMHDTIRTYERVLHPDGF